ncbi:MAG: hypothetical protein K0Q55_3831, partial [Verrucomicrobia bacterium]|nr:hypothetical protein [Verrucomicrobiota bacterium]
REWAYDPITLPNSLMSSGALATGLHAPSVADAKMSRVRESMLVNRLRQPGGTAKTGKEGK